MTKLTYIDAKPLLDYLRVEDSHERDAADAIFVVGSGSMGPAHRAATLWQHGFGEAVAFMSHGGRFGGNVVFGASECDIFAQTLVRAGVPNRAIIYPITEEDRTTNTLMEAQASVPFLRKRLGTVKKVLLCSRAVHQRRAWATFSKQHPDVVFRNFPDDEPLTFELLPRIVQEFDRLREYAEKGDIVKQKIPADIARLCEKVRKHLAQ